MTAPTIHRPTYYDIPGTGVSAPDAIDALELHFNLGCVLKYVVRQGRKPDTPALKDLRKARDCLQREIERLEGGGAYIGLGAGE